MDEQVLAETRRAWHAVGELVIAGPQHQAHGTIRLRPADGGFEGVALRIAVIGHELVWATGSAALSGQTCRELGRLVGVEPGPPVDLYHNGCGIDLDEPLAVDPTAAAALAEWLAAGDSALRSFAPGCQPVLWPEHFDLGITVDDVNYGISLGDSFIAGPYAYVGPWDAATLSQRDDPFWNAPFGAARAADQLPDPTAIEAFLADGRDRLV